MKKDHCIISLQCLFQECRNLHVGASNTMVWLKNRNNKPRIKACIVISTGKTVAFAKTARKVNNLYII